ncbi:hypothetical protein [Corynebacterium dentalis]|uniref:hypothetical protein n=1 Tax=Corynebacterium dentalis TaxID=2014528 RepID=UPI000C073B41|nr:hypothetical protein [Corynebacterium dentalis]
MSFDALDIISAAIASFPFVLLAICHISEWKANRTMNNNRHCSRCGRRMSLGNADQWNEQFDAGHLVGFVCDTCLTSAERRQAAANAAALTYKIGSKYYQHTGTHRFF